MIRLAQTNLKRRLNPLFSLQANQAANDFFKKNLHRRILVAVSNTLEAKAIFRERNAQKAVFSVHNNARLIKRSHQTLVHLQTVVIFRIAIIHHVEIGHSAKCRVRLILDAAIPRVIIHD